MTYAVIVKTRSTGTRVYGPFDAETAIQKFDSWEAKKYEIVIAGYDDNESHRPEDPVEVSLGTFAAETVDGN